MDLSSKNKVKVEGGMASMTDLVFLLLIFFIIMSLLSDSNTPLDLPKTEENLTKNPDVIPTILVTEDNQYVVTPGGDLQHPMSLEEIKPLVQQAVINSQDTKLKIAGHRNARYEAVFQAMALAQANAWDPVIAYEE